MGKSITKSGSTGKLSENAAKGHVKQNKFRLNYIESPVLNRFHTDLKLKEEIESIDWKWRR